MPSRTVRYWYRETETTYSPLATSRRDAKMLANEKGLIWCPVCSSYVKPDADGVCAFCGIEKTQALSPRAGSRSEE